MAKLFDDEVKEEIEVGTIFNSADEVSDLHIFNGSTDVFTEVVNSNFAALETIQEIRSKLINAKGNTSTYLVLVDAYSPILKKISANLGKDIAIPSLEDYRDPFLAKHAHGLALEGIDNIVGKVWKAIRDFFAKFLRNLSEFSKRLVKANLQIDTYEKYVPELLRTIRAKKLEPIKGATVQSKLGDLLKPDNIDKVDTYWLLNNTSVLIDSIIDNISHIEKTAIPSLGNKLIQDINKALDIALSRAASGDRNGLDSDLEVIYTDIAKSISTAASAACPYVVEPKDLSEELYDRVASLNMEGTEKDATILSMIDASNPYRRLPLDFNMLLIIDGKSKIYTASTEGDRNIASSPVGIIDTQKGLEFMYDRYKDLTKRYSPRRLDDSLRGLEGLLDKALKSIPERLNKIFDEANKATVTIPAGELSEFIRDLTMGLNTFNEDIDIGDILGDALDALIEKVNAYQGGPVDHFLTGSEFLKQINPDLYEKIVDIIEDFKADVLNSSPGADNGNSIKNILEAIERIVISYIQALQVTVRTLFSGFNTMVTDVRYELLKYVYDSAREFA